MAAQQIGNGLSEARAAESPFFVDQARLRNLVTVKALTRTDLFSLEEYAQRRPEFRAQVMARQLRVGEHTALYFEESADCPVSNPGNVAGRADL